MVVRDAVVHARQVSDEERPEPDNSESLYAVFTAKSAMPGETSMPADALLGLVSKADIPPGSLRIFADLLPRTGTGLLPTDVPLEEALSQLLVKGVKALPVVDQAGLFAGVVTLESALTTLYNFNTVNASLLMNAVEQTEDSVLITDKSGIVSYVNPAYERMTGYTREEILGKSPNLVKSGKHDRAYYKTLWKTILSDRPYKSTFINRHKNGNLFHEEKTITPIKNSEGSITHFVSTGKDLTERKQVEALASRFGKILDQSYQEIYIFDAETLSFVLTNQGATRDTGYSRQELLRLSPLDLKPEYTRESFEALISPLKHHEKDMVSFETVHRRKDGSLYPVEIRLQFIDDEDSPVFIAIVQDVSDRRQAEQRLNFLAYHDSLTGLPNRAQLFRCFDQIVQEAKRYKRLMAVLLLDLDRFKLINDSHGHIVGDNLLCAIADRLVHCMRPGDTVSRFGGDEFVVLANVAHVNDVGRIVRKIRTDFKSPVSIGEHTFYISVSIGICLYPSDNDNLKDLLKNADSAMYEAKRAGRDQYHFFTPELNERSHRRLRLETALNKALENGEFILHYQPQLNLKNGRLRGVEALMRWRHPELGMVSPGEFIPLAEEIGLILPLSQWLLDESCAQAVAWIKHDQDFKLSVNVSSRQFRHDKIIDQVEAALSRTGLQPHSLELEITESILMEDVDNAIRIIRTLHEMQVNIAMDDFGTGYSSLAYLKNLPLDLIKIDQSFIRDIEKGLSADISIIHAIIALCRSLRKPVLAEGVETQPQLDFLRRSGCDAIQGYYFCKPKSAAEIENFFNEYQSNPLFPC